MANYLGTDSNNTYNGTSTDDQIYGYGGGDTLQGGNGSDHIEGGDGNDTLKGDTGDDTLQGGNGADTYLFTKGDGMDTILNSDTDGGKDVVKFTNVTSTEVTGVSSSGTSLILSYGASDSITIPHYFSLTSEAHIDIFPYPDYRIDEFQFSDGVIWTWDNIKTKIQGFIEGTEGDDVLNGYVGVNNIIYGLGGTDFISGGSGDDIIVGGKGDDYWSLDDSKFGLLMDESGGADTYLFAKGDGRDEIYNFDTDGSKDVIRFVDVTSNEVTEVRRVSVYGDDLKLSYGTSDSIIIDNYFSYADYRIDEFQFSDGVIWTWNDIKTKVLQGTAGDDRLQGYDGEANTINGLAGNDVLLGGNGNDKLNGGTGADAMSGGAGNDSYTVDNSGDTVTETSTLAREVDSVSSSVSFVLVANVENLTLTGGKNLKATGNAKNNVLKGNAGSNTLDGKTGADRMAGGLGNDSYVVDDLGDTVTETSTLATEIDSVSSAVSFTLDDNVENLTLTGTANINATGNSLNNTLVGNDGNNILDGGAGADNMAGGLGNDSYVVDNSGDVVTETSTLATEMDSVSSSFSFVLGANLENLTLTSTAANATGNSLNNILTGNASTNALVGGAGNDTLVAGEGVDVLTGGTGKDALNLAETVAKTDTVKIATSHSTVTGFDVISGLQKGLSASSAAGVDKLDLVSTS
ncbi:calcium-binding protein, partial [Methylosoma difficile]